MNASAPMSPAPEEPTRPARQGRASALRWARALAWIIATVIVLAMLLAGTAWWILNREDGLLAAAQRVPGLEVSDPEGKLDGGPFQARRVTWKQGDLSVTAEDVAWQDLRWTFRPYVGAWFGIEIDGLSARRVDIQTGPSKRPRKPPTTLRLPIAVQTKGARAQTVQVDALPEFRDVQATLQLGADGGAVHRVESLVATWQKVRFNAKGDLGTDAPLPVRLDVGAATQGGSTPAWQGEGSIKGPMERLDLSVDARASDAALSARTQLEPFAAWPLTSLDATLRDVDLSAFFARVPPTRIRGHARLTAPSSEAALTLNTTLDNAWAGAWHARRLPVERLSIDAQSSMAKPDEVDLRHFELKLAGDAGIVKGSGRWVRDALTLTLAVDALKPSGIDAHLAAMTMSGPATLSLKGLPSPDALRARRGTASDSGAATASIAAGDTALNIDGKLDARLTGRLDVEGTPPAQVSLATRGTVTRAAAAAGTRVSLDVERLELRAAGARGEAKGTVKRDDAGAWTLKADGSLVNFDPLPWFPGAPGSAWREGKHRIDGRWRADVALPAVRSEAAEVPAALLHARGVAQVQLGDSRIAGVPLQGEALWQHAPGEDASYELRVQSTDNSASAQGRWAARPQDDRLKLKLQAPMLASLAPWARLHPTLAAWLPRSGSASGEAQLEGRWPQVQTSGKLEVTGVQLGEWRVGQGRSTWRMGTSRDERSPWDMRVEASSVSKLEASRLEPRVEAMTLNIEGSLGAHRIELEATSPVRPPRWSEALVGDDADAAAASRRGTAFKMQGTGAWSPASLASPAPGTGAVRNADALSRSKAPVASSSVPAGPLAFGGTWQLRLAQAQARSRTLASAPAWFEARDLRASVRLSPSREVVELAAEPGSARMLGANFVWTQARWLRDAAPGAPAAVNLDARLEPLRAAPLLARLMPEYGFGGDLQVAGQFIVRTTPQRFDVDAVIERSAGDLSLTDEGVTQNLGLSDLRIALSAQDGTWHFTQAVAGTNLGILAGAQTVRVPPATRWPSAQTPLEGVMSWRVDNLTALAPWMPAGWRMGGNVTASASVGGRFGAPTYTGRVSGDKLSVRNILQGVDVHDGVLELALQGDEARIERFVMRAGDGELRAGGGATFGAAPTLSLMLDAQRFQALGRVDRRLVTSGKLGVRWRGDELQADGKLVVDEGLVDLSRRDAPTLDSDISVVRGQSTDAASSPDSADRLAAEPSGEASPSSLPTAAPARRGPLRNPRLNLQVDLGEKLRLKGRGIDTVLQGSVAITSPSGRLAVNGAVRTAEGTYTAYGQNLAITRGLITFTGAVENPRLDIVAERPNLDIRAGVSIAGTAVNPRVRLFSEPEMSDTDKLSWLMLGRAPEGLGRADTALLQRAALAIWAGEDGESPSDALLKTIGLDEFSLRQTESGDVRETVVRVGKQIGRRWYVGYERGVNSATGTWQVIYRVAQRFTVRAQSGADNSLDGIWTWRWN